MILDVLCPVAPAMGQLMAKQKGIPTSTSKILIHNSTHVPPLRIGEVKGKMKLNEPGRQKLGR